MDETDPDVGHISFDRGEERHFESSEAVAGHEIESSTHPNKDFKPANSMDTVLNICPYENADKPTQKDNGPDDQDHKEDSDYNDPNKDVSNDHDAQDSANFQDNQENSDDQDGSCSSDENSNQDTSCSDNCSNTEGEFQATGDNETDLTDREERGLHNQHHHSYQRDLATFPDDQAVDYSAAFPSNRLTTNSSIVATVIMPKRDTTAQLSESDNAGSESSGGLANSFADFSGFSACLSDSAKQQSVSPVASLLSDVNEGSDVPQTSSTATNSLQQLENDSNLEQISSAKDPGNECETVQSIPLLPSCNASTTPATNGSTSSITKNSEELSAQNLDINSETSAAIDAESKPAPVQQLSFRQLRSRSVALNPNTVLKPRQARGRRRTGSNKIRLDEEGQCQSLPPVSFTMPTTSGSETTSLPVTFNCKDLRPRSASPSCFSLPADTQNYSSDSVPSVHQVVPITMLDNGTSNHISEASNKSQDSSKQPRNGQSSYPDGVSSSPACLIPSVSGASDVLVPGSSSSVLKSSNDDPAPTVPPESSNANNSQPDQTLPFCQKRSEVASKPEPSFVHGILNIPQDDDSRCESSETTDDSSFPKRKKRMKLKTNKKRICQFVVDSSDEEDDQINVQPSTSFDTIADQSQTNSSYSPHQTSVNAVSCIQLNAANSNAFCDSSSSELEMQVDTGAESEEVVKPGDLCASNSQINFSGTSTDHLNEAREPSVQSFTSKNRSNAVNDDSLPEVESEVTIESSSIKVDETVTQTTSLVHIQRLSGFSADAEPSGQADSNSESTSNMQHKSDCEGKKNRRRFKRTKTRLEEREDVQSKAVEEESSSADQSTSNRLEGTALSGARRSGTFLPLEDDSTLDELPGVDVTSQTTHSNVQEDRLADNPPVADEAEPIAVGSSNVDGILPGRSSSSSTRQEAETCTTASANGQTKHQMTKDLLLWKRRLAKYEQLLHDSETVTTDTDDSSSCSAQRHVWIGMRNYYLAKIESASLAAATGASGASNNNSSSTLVDNASQPRNADYRTEQRGDSSLSSNTKSKRKKKNRRSSLTDRRRWDSAPEERTRQLQQVSTAAPSPSLSPQQPDSLPVAADDDANNDHQQSMSDDAKVLSSGGRNGRNYGDHPSNSGGVDDAVIVEDDDDDGKAADDADGCSSSSKNGASWRDRDWLSMRKRPKHVYRKRRGSNKGADADVVDLTNEMESDPDDGDVEVLQHDKPVVYLKTEHRRKRRRAARLCAQDGSSDAAAAAAQTIDISNNDATPPPAAVDMTDPNILFGMLLDLPEGYQLPLAPSSDTNTIPRDEEEERGGPGDNSNSDGEKAARLCQPSGPDLLEAVSIAHESKHPTGGEGSRNQAGCSSDATLAGGSSYGGRWGGTTSPNTQSFPSTSGGASYGGVSSGAGPSDSSSSHYSGAGGQGDLGFGFRAGPSSSSAGGGSKSSEKAMHMEKLWVHLDVPPEDIAQCRLRQSVVDLEVPCNFDYDCTNSPPYQSQFASGSSGPSGPSSEAAGTHHSDRQSFASSQFGDVGKFESEPRGTRRRPSGYQPGTSINLAGTSSANNNNGGGTSNSSLYLLPRNNPFRMSQRTRNPGYLGGSSASNSPTEVPSDHLSPSTSQSNVATDTQGSSSSTNSTNLGHNPSEPVPKIHLVRRCKLWESSSTTPSTPGNGATSVFHRSLSNPIHVSSSLDLPPLPGPSHRRGPFPSSGGLHQDASSSSFGINTSQVVGDPFGSSYRYNPRHPQGFFNTPYLPRVGDDARNAAAVASILPSTSNNALRIPGDRQNVFDPSNSNGRRTLNDFFWRPNLPSGEVGPRNASYNAGNGSGHYNDNSRGAAGSSGSGNRAPHNNNSDIQFLAANLPDSLIEDSADDDVLMGGVGAVGIGASHTSRGSSHPFNPSATEGTSFDRRRTSIHYRGQPDPFDVSQPSGSSANTTEHRDQPSTTSGGGGSGGGDSGNNMEISCPICLDTLTEIKTGPSHLVSTVCGHLFCNGCLEPAVRRTKQCPTCRRKLTKKQYHKVYL